ncbi:MAG: helix-turn-helix domain-containing protein [Ruminococcus sp.]|nr:helix-turn-helix domain-containing protein [Ruminococcus sp.]
MTSQKKYVAQRLRYYREACALSQKQIADALNIDRSTYAKYEGAASEPNLTILVKLAAIFNIPPTELLPMEDDPAEPTDRLKDVGNADSPIYQLSKEERGLIALYRSLSKEEKAQVRMMMGNMSKKDRFIPPK